MIVGNLFVINKKKIEKRVIDIIYLKKQLVIPMLSGLIINILNY